MGMFSQLAQGVDWSSMGAMALRIVAVLLCLVVHEVCHGLAAYWLGDPTAKQSHRCPSPIHHLDPFGLLMMVVVGFGWAKPCRWTPLLPQAQAGHGHHRAGRTGFQLPVGLCVGDPLQWIVRGAGGAGETTGLPWTGVFRRN